MADELDRAVAKPKKPSKYHIYRNARDQADLRRAVRALISTVHAVRAAKTLATLSRTSKDDRVRVAAARALLDNGARLLCIVDPDPERKPVLDIIAQSIRDANVTQVSQGDASNTHNVGDTAPDNEGEPTGGDGPSEMRAGVHTNPPTNHTSHERPPVDEAAVEEAVAGVPEMDLPVFGTKLARAGQIGEMSRVERVEALRRARCWVEELEEALR